LGPGIDNQVDLVAEKDIFLILVSPLGITVRVISGAVALPFTEAGFLAEAVGMSPQMSGIDGGIATKDYFQRYGLGNKLVETFIENILAQTMAEVGETAV
jgi:hypothetical protein